MDLKITGVTEIDRALAKLERTEARKVIRSSMREALKIMQERVVSLAPVGVSRVWRGQQHEAGTLKKALKVRAQKVKRRGEIALAVRTAEGDYKGEQFYAAFVEYGTKKQTGQKFMERGFEQTQARVRDKTNELIRAKLNAALNWWKRI
jgi:HK97 gp10 family phage protein